MNDPHGDASVYSVIVRLAQKFQMYPTYLKAQGNFGSEDGSSAAAYRYTETNMTMFAYDAFFKYWKDEIIDFKPNFDTTEKEPECLMSNYPIVLLKGSFGLSYALYTGIPPFNITEVLKTVKKLLKNPNAKVDLLPDFPLPCHLVDTNYKEIFETGEGNFRVRGIIEDEGDELVITSIPYQTNTTKIIDAIISLVKDKKIIGIYDIVDDSTFDNKNKTTIIRIILKLKKGAPKEAIKDRIFKSTPMEQTFAVNFELVDGTENIHYNLKSIFLDWIDYARDMKSRLALYEYKKLFKEYHMKQTVENILRQPESDKVILGIMRNNKGKKQQIDALIKKYSQFKLTELQAKVILEWRLTQYSEESIERFSKEVKELKVALAEAKANIFDKARIDTEIERDMDEGIKKYGRERVSKLIEVKDENHVVDKDYLLVVTKKGFVKKFDKDLVDEGADNVGALEQGDKVLHLLDINNKSSMLVFDSKGKCYKVPVNNIEPTPISSIGSVLSSYINTENKIVSIMKMPEENESENSLIFITKNGIIKKSLLSNYMSVNKSGLIAIGVKNTKNDEDDSLVDVIILGKRNKDILIYTENGKAIRFNTRTIPTTLRMSSGVNGIKLKDDDSVIGMKIIEKDKKYIVVATNQGNGKRYLIDDLEKSERGKEGSNLIRVKDKEKIIGIKTVDDKDTIDFIFNNRTETIKVKEVPKLTLISAGKKIVDIKRNEQLINID